MTEVKDKLTGLKELITSIRDKVDSMCKETCKEYGISYEDEFLKKDDYSTDKCEKDIVSTDKSDDLEDSENKEKGEKSSNDKNDEDKEDKEDNFKKYEIKAEESSINCHTLYHTAKTIFESRNGINEDSSDYCFDDFVRECTSLAPKITNERLCYFGVKPVCESDYDDFDRFFKEWAKNGRDVSKLDITGNEREDELKWKERMRKILGSSRTFDYNRDGILTKKEAKKFDDANIDIRGKMSDASLLKRAGEEMKSGVTDYLGTFMPTSWARGITNATGKAVSGITNKISNTKVGRKIGKTYNTLGGNKALALGTLGGLAFGPIGGAIGAGAGKLLQKVVDFGNKS